MLVKCGIMGNKCGACCDLYTLIINVCFWWLNRLHYLFSGKCKFTFGDVVCCGITCQKLVC